MGGEEMAFNVKCFKDCVRSKLTWQVWLAIGIFIVAVFLICILSWGLALPAAIAWAAGAGGAAILGVLATCYGNCR
jgi:hypothetical protein